MKKHFIILVFMAAALSAFSQKQYTHEWKKIDSLFNLGQAQTAQKLIEVIYHETKQQANYPQFVKACIYQAKGNSFEDEAQTKTIMEMEVSLKTAEFPVSNILHSMLASLYWRFYIENRWKFQHRSVTAEEISDDIATWDLKKIVAKCMEHYELSLSQKTELQKNDLKLYDAIIIKGAESKKFRPTLFDFVAHQAINFYASNESGLTQPADRFVPNQSEYLSDASDFIRLKLTTADKMSFKFQALQLYQEILTFHLNNPNPEALVVADLERLNFVRQNATFPEKDTLFLNALQNLEKKHLAHPVSTEISFEIAALYNQKSNNYHPFTKSEVKWDKKKAYELADAAIKRFPNSSGSANCKALIAQIQATEIAVTCEAAVPIGKPLLASVLYKNIGEVYCKIVPSPFQKLDQYENNTQKDILKKLNKKQPVAQWKLELPTDDSFQPSRAEIKLPKLVAGYYALIVSDNEEFAIEENTSKKVNVAEFYVTDISYLSQRNDNGSFQIGVLDRSEGTPIANVKVQKFYTIYDYNIRKNKRISGEVFTTNSEGIVAIPPTNNDERSDFSLTFTKNDDKYESGMHYYGYGHDYRETEQSYISFFTDRAIYRPGQTVYFKGIAMGHLNDSTWIRPNMSESLRLLNVNHEEVANLIVTTNEFGTFSGSFVLPSTGLLGQMSIQSYRGSIYFNVEEYKRPKFEVTFEPLKDSYKLNEKVTITGNAKTYAGSAVSEAKVKYRVVREARYPRWCWWWGVIPTSPSQEIANGELLTETDGTFKIPFTAIPDATISKQHNPIFNYTVYAEVVDLNGETHQNQTTVQVGYQALMAETDLGETVNFDEIKTVQLKTTNLAGNSQAATGTLTIWKLKSPNRILRERLWERPDKFTMPREEFEKVFPNDVYENEDNLESREYEKQVFTVNFNTATDSVFKLENIAKWAQGYYLVEIKTQDRFGEKVEEKEIFAGFTPSQNQILTNEKWFHNLLTPTVEPNEKAKFVFGTAYPNVHVMYDLIEDKGKITHKSLKLNSELKLFEIPVTESNRGGFSVNMVFVKHNRVYNFNEIIDVPYTNKQLDIKIATFRDKLQPGQQEEWQLTIKSKDEKTKKSLEAELLAGMYDASLDAFAPNLWNFFPWSKRYVDFSWNYYNVFATTDGQTYQEYYAPNFSTRVFDRLNWFGYLYDYYANDYENNYIEVRELMRDKKSNVYAKKDMMNETMFSETEDAAPLKTTKSIPPVIAKEKEDAGGEKGENSEPKAEPQPLQIRKNFNETAFFMPQLATNAEGEVVVKFQMPEALTRWKFQGLAHTKDLKIGKIEKTLVTQKDLMIFTNPPRFFRENDTIYFSAKINNISDLDLNIESKIQFFDALTMQPISGKLLLENDTKTLTVPQKGNKSVAWKLHIPEGLQAVTYRITATSNNFSDGEENVIPVLTNRMLVTESLPLPIRGNQTKDFRFEKLINSSNASSTLRNFKYTLEFTSNPAWYAVQALPYMMEYPYECSEQAFSRFYANSIATYIANSDPKIKQVFDIWRNYQPDALKSNLEKNEELKAVLLEETPWVRQAKNESDRKQRVAILFDLNRMKSEMQSALRKVERNQTANGGFSWFNGGKDDPYITQHIVSGFGHLQHLGITGKELGVNYNQYDNMIRRAIRYMDDRMRENYEEILRLAKKNKVDPKTINNLSYTAIHYLYARSFFIEEQKIEQNNQKAFDYFKTQAEQYWLSHNNYLKGMIALSLNRYNNPQTAQLILKSLSETALHSDEMGMYWRSEQHGWWWYQAPIETQALLIEAFNEVAKDTKSVDELKIWLLKQKQTTDWKTTKATCEAVYALLKTGGNLLTSDQLASISLGNQVVDPYKMDEASRPEAGTGYFKAVWNGGDIKPEMGKIEVKNPNPTVAWGAVYWQYFEQLDKITFAETPVKLSKKLFVKKNTPTGPQLYEVGEKTSIHIGDKVVVRVELRSDRDMEYVHLKDMRAAAFEPVNVLSRYKWQDGLGYYESTRDASTNFFISYLKKGTYVFEYELFATQIGEFSNGITSVQCMYAPEFSAHSEGIRVKVVE